MGARGARLGTKDFNLAVTEQHLWVLPSLLNSGPVYGNEQDAVIRYNILSVRLMPFVHRA